MKSAFSKIIIATSLCLCCNFSSLYSQSYSDGPMRLIIRVNYAYICCYYDALFAQEVRWKFWAKDDGNYDALGWRGGQCIQRNIYATGWIGGPYGNTYWLMEEYYGATVPSRFDLYIDAWEEDGCGGNCSFENNCTLDDDDAHCGPGEFASNIYYRSMGPPCQWNTPSTGYDAGACGWQYGGEFNTYWQYTGNVNGTHYWRGQVSNDWNVACNWSTSAVPTSTKNVIIPASGYTYSPIIYNGTKFCNTLELQGSTVLEIKATSGAVLQITQ